jgi:hypothetical protein
MLNEVVVIILFQYLCQVIYLFEIVRVHVVLLRIRGQKYRKYNVRSVLLNSNCQLKTICTERTVCDLLLLCINLGDEGDCQTTLTCSRNIFMEIVYINFSFWCSMPFCQPRFRLFNPIAHWFDFHPTAL